MLSYDARKATEVIRDVKGFYPWAEEAETFFRKIIVFLRLGVWM